jgi:hypothetical protein
VERHEVVTAKRRNAVCVGFEVVEKLHSRQSELPRQRLIINRPRKIRQLCTPIDDIASAAAAAVSFNVMTSGSDDIRLRIDAEPRSAIG